jgi:hypothetical protein
MLFCILVVELQIHLSRNKGHLHYFPPPIHNILLPMLSICFLAMYMLVVTIQRFILVFAVHIHVRFSVILILIQIIGYVLHN